MLTLRSKNKKKNGRNFRRTSNSQFRSCTDFFNRHLQQSRIIIRFLLSRLRFLLCPLHWNRSFCRPCFFYWRSSALFHWKFPHVQSYPGLTISKVLIRDVLAARIQMALTCFRLGVTSLFGTQLRRKTTRFVIYDLTSVSLETSSVSKSHCLPQFLENCDSDLKNIQENLLKFPWKNLWKIFEIYRLSKRNH